MTTGQDRPDDHEDDALQAAWRASSRESPPPALDAAILAAAHRAVGSAPRKANAEALRPPKWWLPFAAAAVIGVVAVSVVQLAPNNSAIDPSSGESAKPSVGMTATAPAAPAAPASRVAPAQETTANTAAPADAVTRAAPSQAAVAKADTAMSTSAAESKAKLAQQRTAPAAAAPAPSPPREQRQSEPMPFPAAAPAAKKESTDTRKDLAAQDRAAELPQAFAREETQSRAALAPKSPPPPAPPLATAAEANAPAARAGASVGGSSPERPAAAAAAAAAAAPAAGTPAPAPRPAPAANQVMRASEPAPSSDHARETASGNLAPLAKQRAAPRAEAIELAKDPDAWIIRIRKLRDGGRVDEATVELREFDALVPNAQQRMPSELRRFMNREGSK